MEPKRKWYQMKRTWLGAGLIAFSALLNSADTTPTSNLVQPGLNSSANIIEVIPNNQEREISVQKIKESIVEDVVEKPTAKVVKKDTEKCHPSYSGACLNPGASDYDCAGGSGNGPYYTGQVRVIGPDVFDLDRDNDGVGCE